MKCILIILLLFLSISHISAQELTLQGRVIDSEHNELPAATVRCYTNDTVLVKGTTSNSKGEFELKLPQSNQVYKLLFNYVGYKALTVMINRTEERTVRLGDVVMDRNTVQMQEVTVLGENRIQTEEKLMVYPTKDELRYSYDGYSVIDVLMIPGLRLDIRSQMPTYLSNEVFLCIDGREATKQEIKDLNAKDIKRVDFYTNGRPDYPDADYVLDFIMKERDYVGTVATNVSHRLNAPIGDAKTMAQYFQGQSEWAVSASGNYDCFDYPFEGNRTTTYRFPSEAIAKTDEYMTSPLSENGFNTYVNYIYKDKKQNFYASLRFNRNDSDKEPPMRSIYSNTLQSLLRESRTKEKNINPALQLRYNRALKNKRQLRIELYGSYGNNFYADSYAYREEDGPLISSYERIIDERSWYLRPKINYMRTFNKKASLSIEIDQHYTHTIDRNRQEGEVYDVKMDNSLTLLNAIFKYRIQKRVDLQVRTAGRISYTRTDGDSEVETDFIPFLRISYLYKKHSLRLNLSVDNTEPNLANRSGNEYREDDYLYFVGNTSLKGFLNYTAIAEYTWMPSNRFSLTAKTGIQYMNHPIYRNYSYDDVRQTLIAQDMNGGRYLKTSAYLELQYTIIPKRLTAGVLGFYERTDATLWEELFLNKVAAMGYLNFFYKGWNINTRLSTSDKELNPSEGSFTWNSPYLSVNVNYNINNWFFGLRLDNPFIHGKNKEYLNQNAYNKIMKLSCSRVLDNVFSLTVNYRFSFGKKKHKFDDTEVKDVNPSTIMK